MKNALGTLIVRIIGFLLIVAVVAFIAYVIHYVKEYGLPDLFFEWLGKLDEFVKNLLMSKK